MGRAEFLASLGAGAYSSCVPRFYLWCAFFQAWLNEKFAPELLESKPEIIECVVEQLDHMVGSAGLRWWYRQAGPGCLAWQIHAWVPLALPGLSAPLSLR